MNVNPRTLAIIQARMGASRLPGKVLLDIAGEPMLVRVIERSRRAKTVQGVVVATTSESSDDPIAALCAARGYSCYRGSLHDVLDRYYQAARLFQAEAIVRITADCPLMDPDIIDETVNAFLGQSASEQSPRSDQGSGTGKEPSADHSPLSTPHSPLSYLHSFPFDFAANRLPPPWHRTYPIGLDVEVCTFQALERAWKEASQPHQREHVMPYLYEPAHSKHYTSLEEAQRDRDIAAGLFRILVVNHDPDYGSLRWTVDTPEDLELIRQVYHHFPGRDDFTWYDVLALFQREPELAQINANIRHKNYQEVDQRRIK